MVRTARNPRRTNFARYQAPTVGRPLPVAIPSAVPTPPVPPAACAPDPDEARPAAPDRVRLLLAIGSTAYRVRPITSALHARAFRLRRVDGKGEYHVTQDQHGHACDCGDHIWRREGTGTACKHVRALLAVRLLDAPAQ